MKTEGSVNALASRLSTDLRCRLAMVMRVAALLEQRQREPLDSASYQRCIKDVKALAKDRSEHADEVATAMTAIIRRIQKTQYAAVIAELELRSLGFLRLTLEHDLRTMEEIRIATQVN